MTVSINTMSINGKDPKINEKQVDKRWWNLKDKELVDSVQQIFMQIQKNDTSRIQQYMLYSKLYGNTTQLGLTSQTKPVASPAASKERLSYNLCQSVTDTLVSKSSKNKPKPMFLTSGGNWTMQTKAKKLEKFVDGVFYANNSAALDDETDRDAFVFGDGIQHIYVQNEQIKFERVLPSELIVDPVEAFYGQPRQLHRFKNLDRDVLIDMFPDKKKLIRECNSALLSNGQTTQNISDEITVLESWHLPSGKDATDGKHAITLANGALLIEDYKKDYFPFPKLSWCKRLNGYWSQGLIEQLSPIQLEMNKLLWVIQRSLHMAGSFKVLIKNGSKIVSEHLTNDIGALIYYNDTPPTYVTPPIIQPEYFQQFQNLKQLGFEQAGISMLSAASTKPAGLDSGKALRTFNDIESERFLFFGHEKERFVMNKTFMVVDMAKDLYEKSKGKSGIKTKYVGKSFIETIEWKDVAMEEDEYVLKTYPISSLPQDPAGRLQFIQEQMQAGLLEPDTGRRLLDFPDLDAENELKDAEEDYIKKSLEKICDDGELVPPDENDNLQLALKLVLQYIAKAKLHNLEDAKFELLLTYRDQVQELMQKAMPPQPPPAPMTPQAVPQAPPTNDMIPNVPGVA